MKQNQTKAVILNRRGAQTHTFFMKVEQHIPEYVNKKGNLIPAFNNSMEFETETKNEVFNDNLAAWGMENLVTWLAKSRLQGKTGLKLSKDVDVTLTIDNKQVKDTMKFTLSNDRIVAKTGSFSALISLLFRKHTDIHKATIESTMNFVEQTKRLLLVAKIDGTKKLTLKKAPVLLEDVKEDANVAPEQPALQEDNFLAEDNG